MQVQIIGSPELFPQCFKKGAPAASLSRGFMLIFLPKPPCNVTPHVFLEANFKGRNKCGAQSSFRSSETPRSFLANTTTTLIARNTAET